MSITHRPKGSMCVSCQGCSDTSSFDFTTMRAIGKDKDGTIVVRCIGFAPKKVK